MEVKWYTMEDLENESGVREIIAMGLCMWATCIMGNTPPEYFGKWMALAREKSGIAQATLDGFQNAANEITKK